MSTFEYVSKWRLADLDVLYRDIMKCSYIVGAISVHDVQIPDFLIFSPDPLDQPWHSYPSTGALPHDASNSAIDR